MVTGGEHPARRDTHPQRQRALIQLHRRQRRIQLYPQKVTAIWLADLYGRREVVSNRLTHHALTLSQQPTQAPQMGIVATV
ncbi:hypothetical protein D3C80_896530 [compost metagenome]